MHCVAAHSGDTCPQNAASLLAVRNETADAVIDAAKEAQKANLGGN